MCFRVIKLLPISHYIVVYLNTIFRQRQLIRRSTASQFMRTLYSRIFMYPLYRLYLFTVASSNNSGFTAIIVDQFQKHFCNLLSPSMDGTQPLSVFASASMTEFVHNACQFPPFFSAYEPSLLKMVSDIPLSFIFIKIGQITK